MWSIPNTPYISPAAIGCRVVRPLGVPVVEKRSPMARKVASGHPNALDELIDMTLPFGIRVAASSSEINFVRDIISTVQAIGFY